MFNEMYTLKHQCISMFRIYFGHILGTFHYSLLYYMQTRYTFGIFSIQGYFLSD